jgi:hypothetical protein
MKKLLPIFLFPLFIQLPASAGRIWLILNNFYGLEKVEMESMDQCELAGAKMISSERAKHPSELQVIFFECLEGK